MRISFSTLLTLLLLFLLPSCGGGKGNSSHSSSSDTIPFKYARLLKMMQADGYIVAEIADPWNKGETLQRLLLVPKGKEVPSNLPEGTIVRIPLSHCVSGTSVHAALFEELGKTSAIAGVCDPSYIDLAYVKEGLASGKIADCGSGMAPDIEAVLNLRPDALFLSPFQNSGGFGKVEGLGIPLIQVADYMEQGPLARAEWVRFYAALLGETERGDRIFNAVERDYNSLKSVAAKAPEGKKFLMNKMDGSAWYVPGGQSPVGLVLADANVRYPWLSDKSTGSLPQPMETIIANGADSEVWLFHYYSDAPLTLKTLNAENPHYKTLSPVKTCSVFADNMKTSGFNDLTPFHPERLLRDIIIIGHPGLIEGTPEFFRPLE